MIQFPNNLVYGFHGIDDRSATAILRNGFQPSTFSGDWLGGAVYFWENDEERAELWARMVSERTGNPPAVIRAIIDLSNCFDLTQMAYRRQLETVVEEIIRAAPEAQWTGMRQNFGRRELDSFFLNLYLNGLKNLDGTPRFTAVRGAFQEGEPLFAVSGMTSGILSLDHIQIGVRDMAAITDVEYRYL